MDKLQMYKKIFTDTELDELGETEILELYDILNEYNREVYDFVLFYYEYLTTSKDYGTGKILSALEAHILTDIADNPSLTASAISKKWGRTPACISQTLKTLEEEGYIERTINEKNRRYCNIHLTDKGEQFNFAHKKYDIQSIIRTNRALLKKYSLEEIILFHKIAEDYREILE